MNGDGVERLAPDGPALRPGELRVALIGAAHGHAFGMGQVLRSLGAEIRWIHDDDAATLDQLRREFPAARVARARDEALDDASVALVATAAIPRERPALAIDSFRRGKDVFAAKPAFTALDQVAPVRAALAASGRRLWINFGERLGSEAAMHAEALMARGEIGRVVQVLGLGPHRVGAARPDWFWRRDDYGGIINDLGSHQCEQFLAWAGAATAQIAHAAVDNRAHREHPGLEDFGEAALATADGVRGYFRVDWLTPEGLGTWGDVRTVVLGTEGYLEMRKTIDLAGSREGEHLLIVDRRGERRLALRGRVGCPFFGDLARDCVDRTTKAPGNEHMLAASELALQAQAHADARRRDRRPPAG